MILFHGSDMVVETPIIIASEKGRDFGFGFYTTDIEDQAIRWANRRALLGQRLKRNAVPTLNIYEYDDKQARRNLSIKIYDTPTMEWMDFIIACRTDRNFQHEYDIVVGKIADDNVGETISFVMSGVMRKEDALERLKFQKINNQICFNTERSLQYLRYTESKTL